MTTSLVLAIDDSQVSPGVLGFLVVAALGVATWLLVRSMGRQMRKIDFDEGTAGEPESSTGEQTTGEQTTGEPKTGEQPTGGEPDRSPPTS